jgi:hypothetical protein
VGGTRREGAVAGFREAGGVTVGFVAPGRSGEVDWANTGMGAPQESELLEVRLEAGEWVAYDVEIVEPGALTVAVEGVASEDAQIEVAIAGVPAEVLPAASLVSVRSAELPAGRHEIRVDVAAGSVVLRTIDVQ